LPINYSNRTPEIGEELIISGERLNLVATCSIDGIGVEISNQSADSFTIVIPAGLVPGLKNLVFTGPAGLLTAQGAITIAQPEAELANEATEAELANEALVSTKLNVGSFNGQLAVYAKGHKGKTLSWKVGNKWFKTTITSEYQVFHRNIRGVGKDGLVEIYLNRQLSLSKLVALR
jgi:hypothetical protein